MNDDLKSSIINHQSSILIIGYGNPLRGDDGVGWFAVQRLAARFRSEQVSMMAVHQLMPELAEPISKVKLAMFIDAAANAPAGQLSSSDIAAPAQNRRQSMTHHLGPAGLLGLAQEVFGHAPEARLFTIGGEDFGHKERLSPAVEQACVDFVAEVSQVVEAALQRELD